MNTPYPGVAERTFAFTFGDRHTQTIWRNQRNLAWADLGRLLTTHKNGRKEGSCLVPAIFRGNQRREQAADRIDVVMLDSDNGYTLDEIRDAVCAQGWAAVIHSTHSHLTTMTEANVSNWDRFFAKHPECDAADFLRSKGYLARVAEGAEPAGFNDDGQILIRHNACPKFRIVLPLSRPWRASDYPDQTAANAAWKERIEALAGALGLSHDQSCTDTSRLFYLPRTPGDGREPAAAIVDGSDCDIWSLPPCADAQQGSGLFAANPSIQNYAEEFTDPETGELINFKKWAKSFGKRFEIVKALKARMSCVFVGHVADGGHHHIRCVNEDAHTSAEADRATFIVNASQANNKGFVYHCRHAHCTGHDRLFFVRRMLEDGWLKVDDLRSTEFLTAEADSECEEGEWPEPLDFLADAEMTGAPELKSEHLPAAIAPFVFDTAARMGVDPAAVALSAIVSLASVMSDEWCIQPKQADDAWTENPRLWGAIVGDPSILKTPILKATTAPIDKMQAEARERYKDEMRAYRKLHKVWKEGGADPDDEPPQPRVDRYMVEGATTEAISEVLREDDRATQNAPARKVLIRQDEMSEWIAGFDRYRSGGKGGADRGAYLRLYNGGRYTVDRVGRGAFAIPNWSACIVGGIQPGPIRQVAKDAADDGLLQRFCYCVAARQTRGEDRRPDAAALARYDALFPVLAALRPGSGLDGKLRRVVLHREAHKHRVAMLDLTEALQAGPDVSDRLKSALGKWPGLWARMTLVFYLIGQADARPRGKNPDDVANVAKASATTATKYLRDVLLPHLLRADAIMFATEQTGHARWIAGFILSKGGGRITARDIIRAYGALRPPERRRELLEVMASLETMGWVRVEVPPDGRPSVGWEVNPKVHSVFFERASRERAERQATKDRIREHWRSI